MRRIFSFALALALVPAVASAQTVTQSPGTQYDATALTGFSTDGSLMTGMEIFGFGVGGSVVSGAWGDLGGTWGVETSLFRITLGGTTDSFDTFAWSLASTGDLFGLSFRGAPGNTIFDRSTGASGGLSTSGSAGGKDFAMETVPAGFSYTAEYTNAVGVGGAAPVGDIYERVDVDFSSAFTDGSSTMFSLDTDNARTDAGDTFVPVPEPASALLLLSGLCGVGAVGMGRKRRDDVA